jgi:hypothetical protein
MEKISATSAHRNVVARRNWQRAVAGVYYGGLCVLLALIISKTLTKLIPGKVGTHIGYDSEGYLLALLLPLWIEYARPRLAGRRIEWAVTTAAAVAMFGVFLLLYNSHSIVGTVKTLNETFFALAFLIPYVQRTRRPPEYVAWGCALGVLVIVLVAYNTASAVVTRHLAEGVVMMILAPIAFDITDRDILQPDRPSPLRVRQAWWVLLVLLPLLFIVLRDAHLSATLEAAARYVTRAQEAFAGMLLLEIYFAIRRSRWLNPAREGSGNHAVQPHR